MNNIENLLINQTILTIILTGNNSIYGKYNYSGIERQARANKIKKFSNSLIHANQFTIIIHK